MLLLTKVRLINWHFFQDSLIDLKETTLLAGDNGSGKSTIIDAIQYALIANIRKIKFNAAAAEKRSSRNLESYCRCKIGAEGHDYVRDDVITHVMLQFEDGSKVFSAGIMVEAFKEKSDTGEHLWILEAGKVSEIEVYSDKRFLNPAEFKEKLKSLNGIISASKRDYNSKLTHLLKVHRRNVEFNPYLEAVIRSVNFTPFSSVDQFVCNYILEEKQVDISAMKENLSNYKEAEREAREIKKKIDELEKIAAAHGEMIQIKKQIILQNYFKRRIDFEICSHELSEHVVNHEQVVTDLKNINEKLQSLDEQKSRFENIRDELNAALYQNDQHVLLVHLQKSESELKQKLLHEKDRFSKFNLLKTQCETLLQRNMDNSPDKEIDILEKEREILRDERAAVNIDREAIKSETGDKKKELEELERGILRYPETTTDLVNELTNSGISARVFADLLDITDETWQNAVEGWLNTQRFNILVPEADFQKAIELYNNLSKKFYGTGIPNLGKMKSSEITPGSLAEIVTTDSPSARRYAAFLLGDVMMSTINTLKDHKRSITKECMSYSSHTARRISEKVYFRWYIGKQARARRIVFLKEEIADLTRHLEAVDEKLKSLTEKNSILERVIKGLYELKTLVNAKENISVYTTELDDVLNQISQIDTEAFDDLQAQISSIIQSIKKTEEEIISLGKESGKLEERESTLSADIEKDKVKESFLKEEFENYEKEHLQYYDEFEKYYRDKTRKNTLKENQQNFENAIKGFNTRFDNISKNLEKLKIHYNREYNTYMNESPDDSDEFIALLKKFRDTELPAYEEKIIKARSDAEKQFKDHFVSRLNEYITDARESFSEINHILKIISFGQDQYRFSITEQPEKRKLLDIIKSAAQINEDKNTLWEQFSSHEDKERIEKLFNSILENDLDSPAVRDICDYRQYFNYDIKITHTATFDPKNGKPLESSLSKVLREKSGGESQTPYYVAIAASFYRFYKDEPGAIRLVLFDEAFNKMDDNRIGNTISFLKKLGMQVITAVPTEKIESISPHMDKTNLVIRQNYSAFIRDYEVLHEKTS